MALISKPMKPPWESRCTMVEAKITRLTSGSTAIRPHRWSLTSGWAGSGKVPSGSWDNCKALQKTEVWALNDNRGGKNLCPPAWGAKQKKIFFEAQNQNQKN